MKDSKVLAESYYIKASACCKEIDRICDSAQVDYEKLITMLMQIYVETLKLPEIDPDTVEAAETPFVPVKQNFGHMNMYWEVFNPYERSEPVASNLSDDISSIQADLMSGCLLYERGLLNDAIWQWRFNFRSHWCFHAVDAIRAINQIVMDM